MVAAADLLWGRAASRTFLYRRTWFLFTLVIFVIAQVVLNKLMPVDWGAQEFEVKPEVRSTLPMEIRIMMAVLRSFIYTASMGQLLIHHVRKAYAATREKTFIRVRGVPVPTYLSNWQELGGLCLLLSLIGMICTEPIFRCLHYGGEHLFTRLCTAGEDFYFPYAVFSTCAMLGYFILLTDLSVFSTRISAYVLVFGLLLKELALFILGLSFMCLAFGCATSSLDHGDEHFYGVTSFLSFFRITLRLFPQRDVNESQGVELLFATICVYTVLTVIFLLNMFIAQLVCAYQATYADMVGFARLNRIKVVHEMMPSVPVARWESFVDSLHLDRPLEFNVGDIGVAGGIQVMELANAHPTTTDAVLRFAGTTSPDAEWPSTEDGAESASDRFARIERIIQKAMKRVDRPGRRAGSSAGASSAGHSSSALAGCDDSASSSESTAP